MVFEKSMLEPNVRALAAQNPDRIYQQSTKTGSGPSCFYVRNGKPDCLIAQGAFMAGMDIGTLLEFDAADRYEDSGAEHVFKQFGFTAVELDWLKRVQQLQDDGVAWGKAVHIADEGELIK